METLNQLAYNIKNKLEGGRSTSNSFISLDQIKYNIIHYRALFLRRELREDADLTFFEQEICLDFCRGSKVTGDKAVNSYLISKQDLPKTLRMKDRYALSIYNKDETIPIPVQHYHTAQFEVFNKYSRTIPRAYIRLNKLYIGSGGIDYILQESVLSEDFTISDTALVLNSPEHFIIRGVFEYPSEVMILNGANPLTVDDLEFPLSADMSARITEGIINGTLPLISQTEPDITHNNVPN